MNLDFTLRTSNHLAPRPRLCPCTQSILQISRLTRQRSLSRIYPPVGPLAISLHPIDKSCTYMSKVTPFIQSFQYQNAHRQLDGLRVHLSHRHPVRFPPTLQATRYPLWQADLAYCFHSQAVAWWSARGAENLSTRACTIEMLRSGNA